MGTAEEFGVKNSEIPVAARPAILRVVGHSQSGRYTAPCSPRYFGRPLLSATARLPATLHGESTRPIRRRTDASILGSEGRGAGVRNHSDPGERKGPPPGPIRPKEDTAPPHTASRAPSGGQFAPVDRDAARTSRRLRSQRLPRSAAFPAGVDEVIVPLATAAV